MQRSFAARTFALASVRLSLLMPLPSCASASRTRPSIATSTPANGVIQMLRLTPRNHDGQYVVDWRIDVSDDCRLDEHEDAFGNITHAFTADGPFAELSVQVEGEVETQDTDGIVRGDGRAVPAEPVSARDAADRAPTTPIADFAPRAARPANGDDTLAAAARAARPPARAR